MAYREMEYGGGYREDVTSYFTDASSDFKAYKKDGVIYFHGKKTANYSFMAKFGSDDKIKPLLISGQTLCPGACNGYYVNSNGYNSPIGVALTSNGIYFTTPDGSSQTCIVFGCYLAANND